MFGMILIDFVESATNTKFSIIIFLHFRKILPNLEHQNSRFLNFISENLWPPLINLALNLTRSFGKTYCVRKCKKKLDIENLILVAL